MMSEERDMMGRARRERFPGEMGEQEVFSRFADIAAYTRLENIEAMLEAVNIPVIDGRDCHGRMNPPCSASSCRCACDRPCVCVRP